MLHEYMALRSARNKMMDLLAIRDHSEKELRKKLKDREYPQDEIDRALDFARAHKWLPESEAETHRLSEKMAQGLHKKRKGILYINRFLQEKGLPALKADTELEIEKAVASLQNKTRRLKFPLEPAEKARLGRFLMSRGFELDTIRKVLK